MDEEQLPKGWTMAPGKPHAVTCQYTFGSYRQARAFLDELADLAEQLEYHPSISFGTTYVNLTLDAIDGETLGETELEFARAANGLYQGGD